MFKQLLSDNRIFGGLVCVLVFVAGGLIYLQTVKRQTTQDIQRTQERLKQRDNPQTGKAEPQTAEGDGHYHADGTYHAESHDTPPAASSTTTGPSQTRRETSQTDLTARTWTGTPLREVSSPDLLSPSERKARDAKIQRLKAEYEALERVTDPLITQTTKLSDERDELRRKRNEISAEMDALPPEADRTAEEQAHDDALLKQWVELGDRSRAIGVKSKALIAEAMRGSEKLKAISAEIAELRRKRRKSE